MVDALGSLGGAFETFAVETELWGQARAPNLLVELGGRDVADLVAALSFHAGELARNPYHVSLPALLIDNVRRGSELVLGQGQAAAAFTFASMYRLRRWRAGGFRPPSPDTGRAVSAGDDVAQLFAAAD